jgi:hypothetical protein
LTSKSGDRKVLSGMIDGLSFDSSAHGRIAQLLLTIPSWVLRYQHQVEIRDAAAVYRSILGAMEVDVRFLVVTHEEGVPLLQNWLEEFGIRQRTDVIAVTNRTKMSVWAEDAFTVCTDRSGQRWVLNPLDEYRPDWMSVAKLVAERYSWNLLEIGIYLQGGNVLVGDDFWLLGGDVLQEASVREIGDKTRTLIPIASRVPVPGFEGSFEDLEIERDQSVRRECRYRGNSESTVQPVFHIDTFITLAGRGADGRYRVLVGDPALAAESLGTELPEHSMREAFDDIAAQLDELGFDVIRNPLPLVFQDNLITKTRLWYYASSNNALVEILGDRKTVWLPTYGHGEWNELKTTDRINQDLWEEMGFDVRTLGNFHPCAVNLGALRCIAKCIVRM